MIIRRLKAAALNRYRKQHGFTLVMLMVALIFLALAMVMTWTVLQALDTGTANIQSEKALMAAQGGIDAVLKIIEPSLLASIDWTKSYGKYSPSADFSGEFAEGSFKLSFEKVEPHRITVVCTGSSGGSSRTVIRGVARISKGNNYAVYCPSPGGFDLKKNSLIKGNVYTCAGYDIPGSGSLERGAICLAGRVYQPEGVAFSGNALEDPGRLPSGMGFQLIPSTALNIYKDTWQMLENSWAGYPGGEIPRDGNWTARTYSFPVEQRAYYPFILAATPGERIIDTGGNPNTVNIIVDGDLTLSSSASIRIKAGSRVNIVARNISLNSDSAIVGETNFPVYLLAKNQLTLDGRSRLEGNCLRLMTANLVQEGTGAAGIRYPGTGELTFYVTSQCDIDALDTQPQEVFANFILDGAHMRIGSSTKFSGAIYCFAEGDVTPKKDSVIYGTISGNSDSQTCIKMRNNSFLLESAAKWRVPPAGIPYALGLNPVGTGGYAIMKER